MIIDAPPVDWQLAFDEPFTELRLYDGASGIWKPTYPEERRSNYNAKEIEFYVDPEYRDKQGQLFGINPFSIDNGTLTIRATPVPFRQRKRVENFPYVSGILTTEPSFAMTYGYVEIRAKLPAGKGLWPTFWLLPEDGTWPPEIDVVEMLGDQPSRLLLTAHSNDHGKHVKFEHNVDSPDLSDAFHTFGMSWLPTEITWYLDGVEVARSPTPADMHKPMFLIINLAVGGTWAGAPDAATRFPAELKVDYIRAYRTPSNSSSDSTFPTPQPSVP
jgi:beta-glucanase (GH16 family)